MLLTPSPNIVGADKPICKHCGKHEHDVGSCFKIIGYPDWWAGSHGKSCGQGSSTVGHGKTPAIVANAAIIPSDN